MYTFGSTLMDEFNVNLSLTYTISIFKQYEGLSKVIERTEIEARKAA